MKHLNILLLFCLLQVSTTTHSQNPNQTTDPSLFQEMKYRSIGPSRGGRATAVAGIPDQPYTFYMGTTGGGVWRTDDAGMNWKSISDGQIEVGSIGAIAVAPSDPTIVYVGTGSACPRGNISPGIGMYKSMDAGESWEHIGLPEAGQIGKVVVHPKHADWVYAAALGNIFAPNKERGVYRSKDGGQTWEQVLYVSEKTGAIDLDIDPKNPRILYAAMWTAERKPWTLVDGSEEGGIWKSKDGGTTWKKLGGGLPTGVIGRIGLSVSPANTHKVYAIIQTAKEEDGGVYRSDDGGDKWVKVNRDHKLRQRGWYYSHITADPQDEYTVYVNNTRLYRSIDGGKTFDKTLYTQHGDNHGLWINPHNTDIMINCNDGGANVSLNGGESWSTQTNQPTSEFYRCTVDNQFPYRVYAGQQDNTTISVPSRSEGDLTPIQEWFSVGGGESGDVAVDPRDPNVIWSGTYSGEITLLDRSAGHARQVTSWPHYTEGWEQRDLRFRFQWNFPIRISSHNPDVIYHTSNYVMKTTNKGQTWEVISPDLTQDIDAYHDIPGGPVQHDGTGVEIYSTIFAFEESQHEEGVLWAGSDDGLVHISKNGGKNWENITPKNMPKEGTVNMFHLSDHDPARAFIAVYKYRDGDSKPYIFRTNNYGKSWSLLTDGKNGIPEGHFTRCVREDPDRKGLLYAGTEFGMYISFDDGAHWQSFQLNLPHTPITDMEITQQDLVLSTQGRAFWVLDDLTPLHQLTDAVANSDQYLFKPRASHRTQLYGFGQGDNIDPLVRGTVFYINLKEEQDSTEVIQLRILDQNGEHIQTYSTQANKKQGEKSISLKKGMNRIVWNHRYPGPKIVDDLVTMVIGNPPSGPLAPTGQYKARLIRGESDQIQTFEILKDPRWEDISDEDLKAQFDLAQKAGNMLTASHTIIKHIRSARKQAKEIAELAVEAGHSEKLTAMADSLGQQLSALEDKLIQNKIESSQDAINYPRKFSNHLGRLYSVILGLDSKPTGGTLERFEELKTEFEAFQAEWQDIRKNALADYNQALEKEGLRSVILPK